MGPTISALVNLFNADQTLREVQARLEAASKNVRIQERRVHDLQDRQKAGLAQIKSLTAKSMAMDVDLRGRDARIEKLRSQQQGAKNNKEYQAFLVEISTGKVDRAKVEEDALKLVTQIEGQNKELETIVAQMGVEQTKLTEMKGSISETLAGLNAEIDTVRPARDGAAEVIGKLSEKALKVYERLAERYDGEAVAPIGQPDPRQEAYSCMACHLELVTDIYNKLKTKDELVFCPNCGRILYAPVEMNYAQGVKAKAPGQRAAATKKSAGLRQPGKPFDPVKAELDKLLRKASQESTKNAVAAGNNAVEFEVFIESRFFGIYKGQHIDNFRRTARYCLHESGVIKQMDVYEKGQSPTSTPTPPVSAPAPATLAAGDDGEPPAVNAVVDAVVDADASPAESSGHESSGHESSAHESSAHEAALPDSTSPDSTEADATSADRTPVDDDAAVSQS